MSNIKITEPVLLLDAQKARRNIRRMVEKARRHGLQLRPHFKTHQSQQLGRWFREEGIRAITVSSVRMAEYFVEDGWEDMTIAFPINLPEIDLLNQLAGQIQLNLTTVDPAVTRQLGREIQHELNIFIKIDVGYHRTGVQAEDAACINQILEEIEQNDRLHFMGFLAHAGHTYKARSESEILAIHEDSIARLRKLREVYQKKYPSLVISYGDTPSCSIAEDFDQIDEIRPGNFVFYDLAQSQIGSCAKKDIALAMACPVVAKHKERNEIILYGGGVHFSKDFLDLGSQGRSYGELVRLEGNFWSAPIPNAYLSKLSQEHGTLNVTDQQFDEIQIGEVVFILPVHACMASNTMRAYYTLDGQWFDHMNGRAIQLLKKIESV